MIVIDSTEWWIYINPRPGFNILDVVRETFMKLIPILAIIFSNQIAAQSGLLVKYDKYFKTELAAWTATFQNFSLSDFGKKETIAFEHLYLEDFMQLDSFLETYEPLITFSEDKNQFIDIFSYQLNLVKMPDHYEANVDIDQAVFLCDKKKNYWKRILFAGPSLWIEDIAWIDNTKFLLVAVEQVDCGGRKPRIYIGNTDSGSFDIYEDSNAGCRQQTRYRPAKLAALKIKNL